MIVPVQIYLYTWDYINTPLIAAHITQGSQEYFEIMSSLAKKVRKIFLVYEVFCHPSLQDMRPLVEKGWHVEPFYTHIWELQAPEDLLSNLKKKKRFHQADSVFQKLDFANEKGTTIIDEFIPLYQETARQIGYKLRKTWDSSFRALANQMLKRDVIRFFTCRNKNGELLGVATYVLNPRQNTAYGWQLAHVYLQNERDFIPALYLYSIKALSSEVTSVDIAEGVRPSLYYYKDSLGTKSVRLYSVETPNAKFWRRLSSVVEKIKLS
jgi:hypothetical protein